MRCPALDSGSSLGKLRTQAGENIAGRSVASSGVASCCTSCKRLTANQLDTSCSIHCDALAVCGESEGNALCVGNDLGKLKLKCKASKNCTTSSARPARTTPDTLPSVAASPLVCANVKTLAAHQVGSGLDNLECDAGKNNAWARRHKH